MRKPTTRVLVVDDCAPIRECVRSVLKASPEFEIVGEASDGLQAVYLAQKLQPDLIILDIGLPKLNGLDAIQQIRVLSPKSKVLFLSQQRSLDLAKEGLRRGAAGYVLKTYAGLELLDAAQAVCQGRQYLSRGLSEDNFSSVRDTQPLFRSAKSETLAPHSTMEAAVLHRHKAQFFEDDASLLVGFTQFIGSALKDGNAAILLSTESHRESVVQLLLARGIDVASALADHRYIPLDADQALATFMKNDRPDPVRFFKVARELVASAAQADKGERRRVSACGECAPLLLAQGKPEAAIQLEQLWDQAARIYDISILCGYVWNSSQPEPEHLSYERICAHHSVIEPHSAGY